MHEEYKKKQIYEHCEIRRTMIRLDVIQSTAIMPDWVRSEVVLVPVACNRSEDCKRERIKCIVYDKGGQDPCPGIWKGDF